MHRTFKNQTASDIINVKDLSGKDYRFDGLNEGVINGQRYLSKTDGIFHADGTLRCKFITEELPSGFVPMHLSLSNASTKSSTFAIPKNAKSRNFFSLMKAKGIVRSARIYTFPDYPGCIMTQVGTAELNKKGLYYHTYINGFTDGLPLDIVAINPYTQYFKRCADGALCLFANTELITSTGDLVRGKLTGQFTFENMYDIPYDFLICYTPKFIKHENVIELEMPVTIEAL